jgi:hypothetical protein
MSTTDFYNIGLFISDSDSDDTSVTTTGSNTTQSDSRRAHAQDTTDE